MTPIDLQQYLQRIAFQQSLAPDLDTLSALVQKHTQAIPFENLDAYLGLPVELSTEVIQHKLVGQSRGGYCYEQNALFRAVLNAIGMQVTSLAARVRWGIPEEVETPASHMLLLVNLAGVDYLVDVGFGVTTPTAPLQLNKREVQVTPHGNYKITEQAGSYELAFQQADGWLTLYRFTLQPQQNADYKVFNWYVSTHPDSVFVKNLVAAKVTDERRYTLRNNELKCYRQGHPPQVTVLAGAEQIQTCLRDYFNITPPAGLYNKLVQLTEEQALLADAC
ncbi:arylamine N-acetyltransferase family protein [Bowmanella denitrificans]|uniref:arylamine N-acetyltransferase family protein n=1 Tax=Bowmanella denitrificans TaxID=366582 RepID=UPI000C99F238|nr:arylamine N-acetyltransferase [Bowmanella denitrificans]